MNKKPKKRKAKGSVRFVTEYVNRWGKLMRARDYGYKAWPFPAK
jgi:hypothetical protein